MNRTCHIFVFSPSLCHLHHNSLSYQLSSSLSPQPFPQIQNPYKTPPRNMATRLSSVITRTEAIRETTLGRIRRLLAHPVPQYIIQRIQRNVLPRILGRLLSPVIQYTIQHPFQTALNVANVLEMFIPGVAVVPALGMLSSFTCFQGLKAD